MEKKGEGNKPPLFLKDLGRLRREGLARKIVVGGNYNGLVVEEDLGVVGKRRLWKVRCPCGKIKPPMRGDSILKSKGKCMCSMTKEGYLDLSGKVFNKLEVLSLSEIKDNHSFWNVLCECGREYISRRDSLQRNVDGCGRHIRPHVHNGNGTTTVDVSTDKHPEVYTLVNTEDFYKYMTQAGWWAITYKEGGDTYVQGSYQGVQCSIHQLITGSNLKKGGVTDHINGNTLDNRRHNLRATDIQGNSKNRRVPSNNTSGYQGISSLPNGKYRAYITVDGVQIGLGTHTDLSSAISARKEALQKYGFHKNHDRK